jgi:hypothetical protein
MRPFILPHFLYYFEHYPPSNTMGQSNFQEKIPLESTILVEPKLHLKKTREIIGIKYQKIRTHDTLPTQPHYPFHSLG